MTSEAHARKHEFPCQSCGAKLEFDPAEDDLVCTHCGRVQQIQKNDGEAIVEYSLAEGRKRARKIPVSELSGGSEVHCTNCAAVYVVGGQASRCPFCDSPVVLEATSADVIAPESLLSFAIDRRSAQGTFKSWVAGRWFAPNDLRHRAQAHGMDGVYLPYWSYCSDTKTTYTGMRGRHYTVSERYTDKNNKRRTRKIVKTRWRPAFGTVRADFDDVLACGSRSLPESLLRRLEPWNLEELRHYQPDYLSGFAAERYSVDLDQGFATARDRMEARIRGAVRRDIGGDTQVVTSLNIRHRRVRFRHLLLPLWISSFRYKDKVYRFAVNARTGKVSGERPYSVAKIAAAVVFGLVVAGLIWWLRQRSGASL